jgi:2-iminobutanoate/2-iminopropanoate deaminase
MTLTLLAPCSVAVSQQAASAAAAPRTTLNPPGVAPLVPVYSMAVRKGDFIFVSGMTGVDPKTQQIVSGGVGAETRQTLENIRGILAAAGASMQDVLECTVFLTDIHEYAAMNEVYGQIFSRDPPARATVAVTALPRPAAHVEIKCSAQVPAR